MRFSTSEKPSDDMGLRISHASSSQRLIDSLYQLQRLKYPARGGLSQECRCSSGLDFPGSVRAHRLRPRWQRDIVSIKLKAVGVSGPTAARTGWQILIAVICATVATLAALAFSIIIYLRPLLKELERLSVTCRSAAESMERASTEFETTSKIMNKDLPTTLDSMEKASLEFEELGQSLNILTGGLVKRNKPAKKSNSKQQNATEGVAGASELAAFSTNESKSVPQTHHEWNAVEALQAGTLASIRKVANDVSSLTAALAPAMLAWRKRLGFVLERVEEKPLPSAAVPQQISEHSELQLNETSTKPADADKKTKATGDVSATVEDPQKELSSAILKSELPSKDGAVIVPEQSESGPTETETQESKGFQKSVIGEEVRDSSSPNTATRTSLLEEESSQHVVEVVKEVTKAALTAAIQSGTSSTINTTGLTDLLQEKEPKFQGNKDEFSHHAKSAKPEVGSSDAPETKLGPERTTQQEVMEMSQAEATPDMAISEQTPGLSQQEAAEAVLLALANAEKAALAAAEASGQLEDALQNAERQASVPKMGGLFNRKPSKKPTSETNQASYDGAIEGAYENISARSRKSVTAENIAKDDSKK